MMKQIFITGFVVLFCVLIIIIVFDTLTIVTALIYGFCLGLWTDILLENIIEQKKENK